MFDPFCDFDTAGYLRNVRRDKDETIIKHFEHNLFRANLPQALKYLASCDVIVYSDFLELHRILFGDYYPWAGQDRAAVLPNSAVSKGPVMFCHPLSARQAVEYGLRIGQDKLAMHQKPGEVMGLFAFGHPSRMGMVASCSPFTWNYAIERDSRSLGRIRLRMITSAHSPAKSNPPEKAF